MIQRFRDPGSGLSHLIGALLSVGALVMLLSAALGRRGPRDVIAFSIFGASLVLLYSASAAYHLTVASPKVIARLRALDHSMIYVLIAGTYTPVCLNLLQGNLGTGLLIAAWSMAALGISARLLFSRIPRPVYTLAYVTMGLVALIAIRPLVKVTSLSGILWLSAGGVSYLAGALIYLLKRPNLIPRWLDFHVIFHVLVLAGSASHFVFIYKYC